MASDDEGRAGDDQQQGGTSTPTIKQSASVGADGGPAGPSHRRYYTLPKYSGLGLRSVDPNSAYVTPQAGRGEDLVWDSALDDADPELTEYELPSAHYKFHQGKIPKEVWDGIVDKFSKVDLNPRSPKMMKQVQDFLTTLGRIQKDEEQYKESLKIVDDSLRNLPMTKSDTIKLNELVIKPEKFNGIEPLPRKWIQEYNECIIANGWSDLIAIKYLPTFLTGAAKDWYYVEVKPTLNARTPWTRVLGLFHDNYLSESDYESLRQSIEGSRQKPGELAANFIPRLRRMLLLLTPNLPEEDQLRQLKTKLRAEYRQLISFSNPKTINELKQACLKIEAGFTKRPNEKQEKKDSDASKSSNKKNRQKSSGSENQKTNKSPFRRGRRRQQSSPRSYGYKPRRGQKFSSPRVQEKDIKCYTCNETGHISPNCPQKGKNRDRQGKPGGNKPRRSVNMVQQEEMPSEVLTIRHQKGQSSVGQPRFAVQQLPINLVVGGGGQLLKQKLICNNVEITAVVDTGAYVTVIDESIAKHFNWKLEPTQVSLVGADGGKLQSSGSALISIEMVVKKLSKTKMHRVAVVRNLTAPMLMGLELMRKFGVTIDLAKNELRFANDKFKSGIRLREPKVIPARSQTIIEANVNLIGHVMAVPFMREDGLLIANSIAEVKSNIIPMVLLNPTNRDVTLRKFTQLASAEIQEYNPREISLDADDATIINRVIQLKQMDSKLTFGDDLTEEQVDQLKCLLVEHVEAFSLHGELGKTNVQTHAIELKEDAEPVAEPLRRRALIQIEETRRQVKDLLKQGIIEESSSPWASAYVLAKKKNGEFRLCIDFRRLNQVTKKTVYPLPHIDECLETLSGKRYFSQLDFKSGFWQIEMEKNSKELTAFRTEDGLFQFKRMPFGLTNAPATFQKMINTVLAGLKGMNLQVFIDDVCVATKTWEEHLAMLKLTFEAVIKANLKIKADKCVFGASSIKFLGHEVSQAGIRQDPDKLKAVRMLPEPKDPKEVKRAMGMFSYYRKFVYNFATLAAPLTDLTRKKVEFVWQRDQQLAFKMLKEELEKNATLAHYNHDDPIRLKTDASRVGVAGLLLQKQEGDWKIVTCCSRRLTSSESNYGITDLEGLAVVDTVQRLRPYLLGKEFEILVDHCALCVLNKRTPTSPRLKRWAIVLSEFNFNIVYTKGNLHCDIDCLSRAPVDDPIDPYLDDKVYLIRPSDPAKWVDDYHDEESKKILESAKQGENDLRILNDVVYKNDLLYVPEAKRREIIEYVHKAPMNGHPGVTATISKLKENYWWPNMREAVTSFIASCETCALNKHERLRPAGLMNSFKVYQPGDVVAIDMIEDITESCNGNKFIIVAVDMFSRFVDTQAVPDKGAPTFTQYLIEYCGRYGVPHSFLTDHSTSFCNAFTKQIMDAFGASHVKSTPYHSQGNAIVERVNQTLGEKLRLVLNDPIQQANWDAVLPVATLAINTSYHNSIGCTPYELTYGKRPPLQDKNLTIKSKPHDMYGRLVRSYIRECHANAVAIQSLAQERSKEFYDKRRREVLFEVGDRVLVKRPDRSSKLASKYQGFFRVVRKQGDIYDVRNETNNKIVQRHVSDLRAAPREAQPEEPEQGDLN